MCMKKELDNRVCPTNISIRILLEQPIILTKEWSLLGPKEHHRHHKHWRWGHNIVLKQLIVDHQAQSRVHTSYKTKMAAPNCSTRNNSTQCICACMNRAHVGETPTQPYLHSKTRILWDKNRNETSRCLTLLRTKLMRTCVQVLKRIFCEKRKIHTLQRVDNSYPH